MIRWVSVLVVMVCCWSSVASAGEDPLSPSPPSDAPTAAPGAVAPGTPPPQAAPAPGYARRVAAPAPQIADGERGRAPRKRHRVGLMIAGLAIFGAGYVGSALSLAASSAIYGDSAAIGPEILVPIAGPWLALSSTNWDAVPDSQRSQAQATLVLQGGLQAVGAVLSIVGISQYASKEADNPRRLTLQFAPTTGGAFGMVRGVF